MDRHQYTKSEIRKTIKLWDLKDKKQISEELGLKDNQVSYLSMQIRKAGYDLPRKRIHGRTLNLIREVISEL